MLRNGMRTTLELPDPLFARLRARAVHEKVTLKQLLQTFVEQGLNESSPTPAAQRSAAGLPRVEGRLAVEGEHLTNAGLAALLEE
jgi:hypothetical protein